jgi:L-lactate utilization protein LutB
MQTVCNLKAYHKEVVKALDNEFQHKAMDKFAVAYRTSCAKAFASLNVDNLMADITRLKDHALGRLDEPYARFKEKAEKTGTNVHLTRTAEEANALIARIATDNQVQDIVKSKSMTTEETQLNRYLEVQGLMVTETDLGEWIIQLRGESP